MSEISKIEWTDATFNPWRGCTKVSEACRNCYAETMAKRNPAVLGQWGVGAPRVLASDAYWRQPLKWNAKAERDGKRPRVFCASMADVFDAEVPDSWRVRLFVLIAETPNLDWLLLTKRPENALRFFRERPELANLPNVWLGTSVENQKAADERVPILQQIPAAVRFLSMEPLLSRVSLGSIPMPETVGGDGLIHWIIAGGESGPKARPSHPGWFRSLRDQCTAAGVPFLFKQWGEWHPEGIGTGAREVAIDWSGRVAESMSREAFPPGSSSADHWSVMRRVGKRAAGRLLDGRTHDDFPVPEPRA